MNARQGGQMVLLSLAMLLLLPVPAGGLNPFQQMRSEARANGTPAVTIPLPLLAPTPEASSAARSGSAIFTSAALGREMPYLVYLPPGYDSDTEQRYPTLYMLHGMGGDFAEWYGYGIFGRTTALIERGAIQPFIIVLPQGDLSYWVDHVNGPAWGAYVAHDLVSEIDGHYRTIPEARGRAVGGLSMGGHGALQLAMNYPGTFAVVGAHSPTLRGELDAPEYFGKADAFTARDPISLIRGHPEQARALTVFLDVGESDWWYQPVTEFHQLLTELEVVHRWQVFPGGHGGEYWAANLDAYLTFYGEALAGSVTLARVGPPLPEEPR